MRALLVIFVFLALGQSAVIANSNVAYLPSPSEKILWIIDISQGLTDVTATVNDPVGEVRFFLKDSQGRVVFSSVKTGDPAIEVINTGSLLSGTYTLLIKDDVNTYDTEVIIQN